MANPLQKASSRRKVIYLGVILGLFFVTLFWRGKLDVPLGNPARAAEQAPTAVNRTADTLSRGSILSQATRLDLRDLDQGDPNLAGSAAQYALLGFRGPVVTALWWGAIEKQKRNEFQEMDGLVQIITELQPNFITPWIFQSWNIAYNVSVENDKLGDMYYYIARGIELLAKGDRRNTKVDRTSADGRRVGSPDIRYQIAFYYQNKFGVSDKVNTLRSLAQLSCIPPAERDPDALIDDRTGGVNLAAFRQFCEKNPQLVRRLRTKLNCARPEDVVQFLRDNRDVPTRFTATGELAAAEEQFPALPPRFEDEPAEFYPGDDANRINDTFDYFLAARAWFNYALAVVPPPKRERDAQGNETGEPLPWSSPRPGEYNEFRYRVPRAPALIIFRQPAPRAPTYYAERLAQEGWFEDTSAWDPDERASTRWFPSDLAGSQEFVLRTQVGSRSQWERAYQMWSAHGEKNGLILSEERRRRLKEVAGYANVPDRDIPGSPPVELLEMSDDQLAGLGLTRAAVEARAALAFYQQNRSMTNFPFFLESARAEQDPRTVAARRALFEANQAREASEFLRAAQLYVPALARWRDVLAAFPDFHRPERSDKTEEDTYEQELQLIQLLKEDRATRARAGRAVVAAAAVLPWLAVPEGTADPLAYLEREPATRFAAQDLLQAVAEDEAGMRIAAAMVTDVAPAKPLPPTAPERQVAQRVEEAVAKEVPAAVAGTEPPTLFPAETERARKARQAAQAAAGKPDAARLQAEADKAIAALADLYRPVVTRRVIDAEFAWMKEFKYPPAVPGLAGAIDENAYWVRPYMRTGVKGRLNLIRPAAAPVETPAGQPGAPPAGS